MSELPSGRTRFSDALVLLLAAMVGGGLAFAWGGAESRSLLAASIAAVMTGPVWILGGLSTQRRIESSALAGLALACVLVLAHLRLGAPAATDLYQESQRAFIMGTRPGVWMPDGPGLRALWSIGLVSLAVFPTEVMLRRPVLGLRFLTVTLVLCLTAIGAAALMCGTGWSPWAVFHRNVSDRWFGFFFHDIIAASWINLVLALGGMLLCAWRPGQMKTGRVVAAVALGGGAVWAQSLHQSDAGNLLVWVVAVAVVCGTLLAGRGANIAVPALGQPTRGLVLGALIAGAALVGTGLFLQRAGVPPVKAVAGLPLEQRRTGEDRLLASEDPRASLFLGDRRIAWETGGRMFLASPLIGWGPAGWSRHYIRFTNDPLLRSFFLYHQFTHNDGIQFLAEWGIAGMLAMGLMLVPPLRRIGGVVRCGILDAGSPEPRPIACGTVLCALAGAGALAVHGQIDFPGQIPAVQALALLLVAGAASQSTSSSPAGAADSPRSSGAK